MIAVGSVLVDAAPTPAKEFAVRTLGTADKPVLLASVAAVLLAVSAVLGLIAWGHRVVSVTGIAVLGLAGAGAAVWRGGIAAAPPSMAAAAAGATALWICVAVSRSGPDRDPAGSRRRLLVALAATGALAAIAGGVGVILERGRQAGAAARRALGLPDPASPAPPLPDGVQAPGASPFITPNDVFYRVDISLVTPRIDAENWTLTVDGAVERPLELSYRELLAMPMIERDITLTCVSNEVGGRYVGTARWLGVSFADLIQRAGVRPGVDQVFSYSLDSGYTCSTPYQAVSDGRDAMIAIGMNGEPLPDAHGFPARMLVPGLFGFVSATKWLSRLEFTSYARREAYWTRRGWATDAPILTQARIDVPKSLGVLPKEKPVLAGVAWAQHRGIARVEIRIDGGAWQQAKLAPSGGVDLWRQWSFVYDGPAGRHSAEVRATDLTGQTQPERRRRVFPAGATGWHQIQFQVG